VGQPKSGEQFGGAHPAEGRTCAISVGTAMGQEVSQRSVSASPTAARSLKGDTGPRMQGLTLPPYSEFAQAYLHRVQNYRTIRPAIQRSRTLWRRYLRLQPTAEITFVIRRAQIRTSCKSAMDHTPVALF
jgi:hypothetical protein